MAGLSKVVESDEEKYMTECDATSVSARAHKLGSLGTAPKKKCIVNGLPRADLSTRMLMKYWYLLSPLIAFGCEVTFLGKSGALANDNERAEMLPVGL